MGHSRSRRGLVQYFGERGGIVEVRIHAIPSAYISVVSPIWLDFPSIPPEVAPKLLFTCGSEFRGTSSEGPGVRDLKETSLAVLNRVEKRVGKGVGQPLPSPPLCRPLLTSPSSLYPPPPRGWRVLLTSSEPSPGAPHHGPPMDGGHKPSARKKVRFPRGGCTSARAQGPKKMFETNSECGYCPFERIFIGPPRAPHGSAAGEGPHEEFLRRAHGGGGAAGTTGPVLNYGGGGENERAVPPPPTDSALRGEEIQSGGRGKCKHIYHSPGKDA